MRALTLASLALIAACARPAPDTTTPAPMAASCPMMQAGGGPHAMHGMAMSAMPADSTGAQHACSCPMCTQMRAQMQASTHPCPQCPMMAAVGGPDSTRTAPHCPMCASGQCPMHAGSPPAPAPGTH